MHSSRVVRSSLMFVTLFATVLFSGCGGSSGKANAANTIEKHVVAAEQFGVTLADIRTGADLDRAKPVLLQQAKELVETIEAMNKAVLDNAGLSDAEKTAAIEPYQMRLAEAERLWRAETQRIAETLGGGVIDEIRGIISKAR